MARPRSLSEGPSGDYLSSYAADRAADLSPTNFTGSGDSCD